jgi:hypothetical protein
MSRAADSFSRFTGIVVEAGAVDVFLDKEIVDGFKYTQNESSLYMLITPLLGDLAGKSYFILRENEANTIIRNSSLTGDHILRDAMLKEIDNVLSAAVITHLANSCKIDLFGDVPELQRISSLNANEMIHKFSPGIDDSLVFKSQFTSKAHEDFTPQFIWKFSADILNKIDFTL